MLENHGIKTSIDERRYKDNIHIERLFRSYKWKYVYLRERMDIRELKEATKEWEKYYNKRRLH